MDLLSLVNKRRSLGLSIAFRERVAAVVQGGTSQSNNQSDSDDGDDQVKHLGFSFIIIVIIGVRIMRFFVRLFSEPTNTVYFIFNYLSTKYLNYFTEIIQKNRPEGRPTQSA